MVRSATGRRPARHSGTTRSSGRSSSARTWRPRSAASSRKTPCSPRTRSASTAWPRPSPAWSTPSLPGPSSIPRAWPRSPSALPSSSAAARVAARHHRAGLLHDIGKLGVSNMILDKPGKPTDEEYAMIRKHPDYSQQILEKSRPSSSWPTWPVPITNDSTAAATIAA